MISYLQILDNILTNGKWKTNRTGIRALTVPNVCFSHNFGESNAEENIYGDFPLLTTKRMPIKSIAVELSGFIGGITNKDWYKERGCHFWDFWSNPVEVDIAQNNNFNAGVLESRDDIQKRINDLGPIYGYQWRRFGQHYTNDLTNIRQFQEEDRSYDQLANIVKMLKENPDDRRMVCSAWNPNQLSQQALPPCHLIWILTHINGVLNLSWMQRSVDTPIGLCCNIASYGMLLCLLCATSNMKPGNLTGILCDCHIYENQIDGVEEQLKRTPKELPKLQILESDIWKWTHKDIKLQNYEPLDKISFGDIAV